MKIENGKMQISVDPWGLNLSGLGVLYFQAIPLKTPFFCTSLHNFCFYCLCCYFALYKALLVRQ